MVISEARSFRHVKGKITVSALCRGHSLLACIFLVVRTFVVPLSQRVGFHLAHHLVGGHQVWHSLVGIHELQAAHVRPRQHGQIDGVRDGVCVIKVVESVLHLASLNTLSYVLLHSGLVGQGVIQVLRIEQAAEVRRIEATVPGSVQRELRFNHLAMEQGIVSLRFEGRHVDRVVLRIET